ncbi:MAG: hypothetical protein KC964_21445, partial [Candidatus Omnitrophica bacterium]|nr:hypothetical protein [Candidatus Omnitrophota bacterium]
KYNGIVPWSSGKANSQNSMETQTVEGVAGSRVQENTYNSEVDYLMYYSHFTGNDWGLETSLEWLFAKLDEYSYKTEDNQGHVDDAIRKRETYQRFGAGQLASLLATRNVVSDNLHLGKVEDAEAFISEQLNKPDNWVDIENSDPNDNEDRYLAYGMLKTFGYGGHYFASSEAWRVWTPWFQRLIRYYELSGQSAKRDRCLELLKRWTSVNNVTQDKYSIRGDQTDVTMPSWSGLSLALSEELGLDQNPDPDAFLRSDKEFLQRAFCWSVYQDAGSIYDGLHIHGGLTARDSFLQYYAAQHVAYWLSSVYEDQFKQPGKRIVPMEGIANDLRERFMVGLQDPSASPTQQPELCLTSNHPDSRMTIEFPDASEIHPMSGGYAGPNDFKSGYPILYFNFDDRTNVPDPDTDAGSTIFTGNRSLNQHKWPKDFARGWSGGDIDPNCTDVIFNNTLRIDSDAQENANPVVIESAPLFNTSEGWSVSFWIKRNWQDSDNTGVFKVFRYVEDDPNGKIQIAMEDAGTDSIKVTLGNVSSSDESYVVSTNTTVDWENGEWKKIIAAIRPNYQIRLSVLDRLDCSSPKSKQTQLSSASWIPTFKSGLFKSKYYATGIISLGGHEDSDSIVWNCQIDNFVIGKTTNDVFTSDTDTMTYFVYRADSSPVMYDADYDYHISYMSNPSAEELKVYPGLYGKPYYMSCPMTDDPSEKIIVVNSNTLGDRPLVEEMAPIKIDTSGLSSAGSITYVPRKGGGPWYFDVYNATSVVPITSSNLFNKATGFSGYDDVFVRRVGYGEGYLFVDDNTTPPTIEFSIEGN